MARSRLRWWLVRLAVAGLVLAGLAAASSLAVRAYAPALSRDRLESALTDALGRPVRIEARGSLPVARRYRDHASPRGCPEPARDPSRFCSVARAGFRVGISSLWRRELVLSTILLQDAILRISGPSRDATPFALDVPDTFALGPITVRIRNTQDRARPRDLPRRHAGTRGGHPGSEPDGATRATGDRLRGAPERRLPSDVGFPRDDCGCGGGGLDPPGPARPSERWLGAGRNVGFRRRARFGVRSPRPNSTSRSRVRRIWPRCPGGSHPPGPLRA